MTSANMFRVWKTHQLAGCPAEQPVKDFEGTLDDLCKKYKRGKGYDDLRPFSNGDFSTSYVVEQQVDGEWKPCGDPRPR